MGQSTNAILFWGYCWDEELDLGIDGYANIVLVQRGLKNPWDNYPDTEGMSYKERKKVGDEWVAANSQAIDGWSAKEKEVEEEFGCDIGFHCHHEYSMPYLYVVESEISASRGYPKPIIPDKLKVGDYWHRMLEKFVSQLSLETPEDQKPQWWLVSYWG